MRQRLSRNGTHAAQVLLTAADIAARTNYLNARQTLRRLIEWGVVPVVNENDTTATDEISFGDNDFLAAQVAILLDARLLVLLSNVEGLHSADPERRPRCRPRRRGRRLLGAGGDGDRRPHLGLRLGRDEEQGGGREDGERGRDPERDLRRHPSRVARSPRPAARRSEPGSPPRTGRSSSFKLWLKYAKPARGRVTVDGGAARVLRESGSSLLPVGITAVEGEFEAGDAVEVAIDGSVLGKGIVDYSARELGQVVGLKSDAVREQLPHAADEAIHRDRFVLSRGQAVGASSRYPAAPVAPRFEEAPNIASYP